MCGEGRHIRAAEKKHSDNPHILWEDLLAEINGLADPKKMTGTEIAWSILRWTGLIIAAWFFVLASLIVLST